MGDLAPRSSFYMTPGEIQNVLQDTTYTTVLKFPGILDSRKTKEAAKDCLDVTLFPNTENKATGSFSCKQTAGRGVPLLATFCFKPTL